MKFKEIKPGMIIHCPKEEDARALLEHLDSNGYGCHSNLIDWLDNDTCYVINTVNKWVTRSGVKLYSENHITEFSDLIEPDEPQMSAVEVLKWLDKHYQDDSLSEAFSKIKDYPREDINAVTNWYSPEEIVQKITAYEAAKKAPKPVEVEYGWYCEILKMGEWGVMETVDQREMWEGDEQTAMDEAAERARQYAVENGVQTYFRVCGICRVKEGK